MEENYKKIKEFLDNNKAEYTAIEHEPMGNSEEVAKIL